MDQTPTLQDVSYKKLRLVVLLAGVALLAVGVIALRRPADAPAPTPVDGTQVADAGPEQDPLPVGPDEFDPAAWRSGNNPSTQTVADVEQELALADAALEAGQLVGDGDDNALARYAAIVRANPDHIAAQEGLDAVVARLLPQLEQHTRQRQIRAGTALYQALRRAGVDDPALTSLGDRLETLEKSAELVAMADADIQAGRLITPAGRSALDRLRRAAAMDPSSVALTDRLVALERRLVDEALAAARGMNFARAQNLIEAAGRARGGSSAVSFAAQQIREFREAQIDQTMAEARLAMRDSRFGAAEQAIEAVRGLGGESDLIAGLDEELRLSRIYNVFRPGETFQDSLADGGDGPVMVVIPHGSFRMGADVSDSDRRTFELPVHRVTFQRGFALGQHEVSVEQFARFIADSGYETTAESEGLSYAYSETTGRVGRRRNTTWRNSYNGRDADPADPVLHVSWRDARAYAAWLSEQTGRSYRLPTEAEFEYAARGGRQSRYWWGSGAPTRAVENLTGEGDLSARRRSWSASFEGYKDGFWGPAPVASLSTNPYGLHDMAGNVMEWVADCWHDSYVRAPNDGSAWVNRGCEQRVVRGAFWGGPPESARVSGRLGFATATRGAAIGFRVARDLVVPPAQVANR